MDSHPGSARGPRRHSNPGTRHEGSEKQPTLVTSHSESLHKTRGRQASADKQPSIVTSFTEGFNATRQQLTEFGSTGTPRAPGTPRRQMNPFADGEQFETRSKHRVRTANGALQLPNPLVNRSTARFNTDRLHAATWLVRTCELKSVDLSSMWRTGGHQREDKAWKPPPQGMPSMAIIRAATCPYHSLHPHQHKHQREDLVRWCLEGDNSGTGIILYPKMMPPALREPLARQSEEMRRCPFCQQCIARSEAIIEEEHENRKQRRLDRRRERQLRELCMAVAVHPLDGTRLEAAVAAWEFERDNVDFLEAEKLAKEYRAHVQELERLMQQRPRNYTDLREAVDAWEYEPDVDKCAALKDALDALSWYEAAVRNAVAASDGWALAKLRDPQGFTGALGPINAELAATATDMYEQHAEASEELRRWIQSAPNLEPVVRRKIAQCLKEWAFADDDPVVDLAKAWLRLQARMAQRVITDMEEMLDESSASMAADALKRPQLVALSPSEDVAVAEALVDGFDRSCQAAGAIAWGAPVDSMPMPGRSFAAAKSARNAAQEVLSRISEKDLHEVQVMESFSPAVLGVVAVIVCLLSGLGALPDPASTCNQKNKYYMDVATAKAVLSDSQLLHCLSIVVLWVGLGTWKGVPLARQAFAHFRTAIPESWSALALLEHSHLAATLFEFIVLVLKYETLLHETCWKLVSHNRGRCNLAQQPELALKTLKPGLTKSQTVAGVWMLYRGDGEELTRCRQRLREYARSTHRKIQSARQAVGSMATHCASKTASVADSAEAETSQSSDVMTLKLLWPSGEEIGTLLVSKAATAAQVKEKLAAEDTSIPNVTRHRFLYGQCALEDHRTLQEQGVSDGCEIVLNPLLAHRLEECQKMLQHSKADAANLQNPGPALSAAAVLCACKVDRGCTLETPSTVMTSMIHIIDDALELVHKVDMEHGSSASSPRTPSKDSCPNTSTFAFLADIKETSPKSLAIPMGSVTEAVRALQMAPDDAPLLELVREFVSIVQDFYERFMPLYVYLGFASSFYHSARAAVRDADEIATTVEELALAPMIGEAQEPVNDMDNPAAALMLVTTKGTGQPEVVGNHAMPAASPHVERAQLAAAQRLAKLLQSPPAQKEDCAAGIRLVIAMLDCYFSPVMYFTEVLRDIAGNLDCNKMSQMLLASEGDDSGDTVPLPPPLEPFQLLVATFRVLGKEGDSDVGLREAWNRVADSQAFKERLLTWSPLRDSSQRQLAHARALLQPLWGCFGAGGSCVGHGTVRMAAQGLYTWAHFATSLAPLLATSKQLAPWREVALEAAAEMQQCANLSPEMRTIKEVKIWGHLRRGLYFPEEPWRWLRLMGCPDPKGFYQRHGLEPNWLSVEGEEEERRHKAEEEARLKEEAEQKMKAELEAKQRAEEEARLQAEEDARRRAEEEARLRAEEEARSRAEEARLKAEEDARLRAEEEARRKAEDEARLKMEAARSAAGAAIGVAATAASAKILKAEEDARHRAEEEARSRAEEDAQLKAAEQARLEADAEKLAAKRMLSSVAARASKNVDARNREAAADQDRLKAEEAARLKALEEARLKAEEEARAKAEEEARLKLAEEARLQAEEAARKAAEDAVLKAQMLAELKAEEDARLKAEEDARLKAEEEARLRAEEEARLQAEEEARLKAQEEERLKAEEEARLKAEEEDQLKADEKARLKSEEEVKPEIEETRELMAAVEVGAGAGEVLELERIAADEKVEAPAAISDAAGHFQGSVEAWGEADQEERAYVPDWGVALYVPEQAPTKTVKKKKNEVEWELWDCLPCFGIALVALYTMAFLVWMYLARKWRCFPFSLKE